MKTNLREAFSFFLFFFYIFTKNEKRYTIIKNEKAARYIVLTPVFLMVAYIIVGLVKMNTAFVYGTYAFVFLVPGTFFCFITTRNNAWEKEHKKREEERAAERERKEKERETKMREEQKKRWERMRAQQRAWEREYEQKRTRTYSDDLEKSYTILGVMPNADLQTVKVAFRKLSKLHHPDMPHGNAEKFILLKKAYDCIKRYNN